MSDQRVEALRAARIIGCIFFEYLPISLQYPLLGYNGKVYGIIDAQWQHHFLPWMPFAEDELQASLTNKEGLLFRTSTCSDPQRDGNASSLKATRVLRY